MRQDSGRLWVLVGLSFAYGVFHAAGPGHGKAVISSYMLANEVALRAWRHALLRLRLPAGADRHPRHDAGVSGAARHRDLDDRRRPGSWKSRATCSSLCSAHGCSGKKAWPRLLGCSASPRPTACRRRSAIRASTAIRRACGSHAARRIAAEAHRTHLDHAHRLGITTTIITGMPRPFLRATMARA